MKYIVARFIGKTSCGFINGKTYKLQEIKILEQNGIIIQDVSDHKSVCLYESVVGFLENWEIIGLSRVL